MKLSEVINEMSDAFIWEGLASGAVTKNRSESMVIEYKGSGTAEHDGDIQGIHDNVADLIGGTYDINGIAWKVSDSSVEVHSIWNEGTEDMSIITKGNVKLIKIQYENN